MDSIAAVAYEMVPTAQKALPEPSASAAPTTFDIAHFNSLYAGQAPAAQAATHTPPVSATESDGFRSVMTALQSLNGRVDGLNLQAAHLGAKGGNLQPSDMLMMAMKAHEFLFHCELTSNVANRTSDGVQQLFREQS